MGYCISGAAIMVQTQTVIADRYVLAAAVTGAGRLGIAAHFAGPQDIALSVNHAQHQRTYVGISHRGYGPAENVGIIGRYYAPRPYSVTAPRRVSHANTRRCAFSMPSPRQVRAARTRCIIKARAMGVKFIISCLYFLPEQLCRQYFETSLREMRQSAPSHSVASCL